MRKIVLDMTLEQVTAKLCGEELVLFEVYEEKKLIEVIVPRGMGERYVVELSYEDDLEREHVVDALLGGGFIQQHTTEL